MASVNLDLVLSLYVSSDNLEEEDGLESLRRAEEGWTRICFLLSSTVLFLFSHEWLNNRISVFCLPW